MHSKVHGIVQQANDPSTYSVPPPTLHFSYNCHRSTELQLLFLIIESQRGFSVVKATDVVGLIANLLKRVANGDPQFTYGPYIEIL